ncbi:hypothetical protein EAW52_11020 [Pseudomonas sp. LTJR-52]|uniref:hypothetical protein n=1 Tax=Pseudomonas sp. LTJR-52 TaxID=2479392 RepID=UPI000EFCD357|nr:hypothetical protein [Pseudomonas sp. LTJR-52]AYN94452.1 hypothetical protein EAW52_11020 [Pseudomonas sp. LTJR-52]
MSIKGKRAQALPILDPSNKRRSGGAFDDSLPTEALELIARQISHDKEDFIKWLSEEMLNFRIHEFAKDQEIPLSQELKLLAELQSYMLETRNRLLNLPATAMAYLEQEQWQLSKTTFFECQHNLADQLVKAWAVLGSASNEIEKIPNQPGAREKHSRDNLLAATAARLHNQHGIKIKRRAAEIARNLLVLCGVQLPEDIKEVERLINKRGGKNYS